MAGVLVVSYSAVLRQAITALLAGEKRLVLAGTCADIPTALRLLGTKKPDVILLGLDSPHLDWRSFMAMLPDGAPPVVGCTSQDLKPGVLARVIYMPASGVRQYCVEHAGDILAALGARRRPRPPVLTGTKLPPDAVLPPPAPADLARIPRTAPVVVVGASTGGCEALTAIIAALPADAPPLLVVIHMPQGFTASFARRLDAQSGVTVAEATGGERLRPGMVVLAPGGRHLLLQRDHAGYYAEVVDGPLVGRHRPSVDVLFRSAARAAGGNAIGVILTGMGADGAACLKELKGAGAVTIGQDRESCVVFGMPMEAGRLGAVDRFLPLGEIAAEIVRLGRSAN